MPINVDGPPDIRHRASVFVSTTFPQPQNTGRGWRFCISLSMHCRRVVKNYLKNDHICQCTPVLLNRVLRQMAKSIGFWEEDEDVLAVTVVIGGLIIGDTRDEVAGSRRWRSGESLLEKVAQEGLFFGVTSFLRDLGLDVRVGATTAALTGRARSPGSVGRRRRGLRPHELGVDLSVRQAVPAKLTAAERKYIDLTRRCHTVGAPPGRAGGRAYRTVGSHLHPLRVAVVLGAAVPGALVGTLVLGAPGPLALAALLVVIFIVTTLPMMGETPRDTVVTLHGCDNDGFRDYVWG